MTGPCSRRTLLRTGALALGSLAGCVGSLGSDTDEIDDGGTTKPTTAETTMATGETTSRMTDSETTDSGATDGNETTDADSPLTLDGARVQSSFFYLTYPDAAAVAAPGGTQFVFADVRPVRSDALAPTRDEFALVADDRRFDPTFEPGPADSPMDLYEMRSAYDPDEHRAGWVAFVVPDPLDAREVALLYEADGEIHSEHFDSATVAELAAPPADFELVSFEAPDRVAHDESFRVSFAVRNVGERDGTFRACLNEAGPEYVPHPVELSVPVGERAEWFGSFGHSITEDATSATFRLSSAAGDREATVEVVSETTAE